MVIAFLAAILFYSSLQGGRLSRTGSESAGTASFHGGKGTISTKEDAACFGQRCHAPSPHRKPNPASAFLNMHESFVACLGCHGRELERRWAPGEAAGGGSRMLSYSPVPEAGKGGRRHDANGPPASCRRCHSAEGRRSITAAGMKGLLEGFEEPIVLRMIEGGGRKWLPDAMQ